MANAVQLLPLLLLLLSLSSNSQRVEVGDSSSRSFTYEMDRDTPLNDGLPGLQDAAKDWCMDHSQKLAVGLDKCTKFIFTKASQKIIRARAKSPRGGGKGRSRRAGNAVSMKETSKKIIGVMNPDKGLAPDLLAYRASQEGSRFHDSGDAPTPRGGGGFQVDPAVRLAWSPSIVHLPGFVDPETCAELIRLARPLMEPSVTIRQHLAGESAPDLYRNSSSAMLGRQAELTNPLVRKLTERIHNLMNLPPDHGEALQVGHYLPGQSYGFHHDAFESAPRSFTFLAYLNTPEGGGATIFPCLSANGSLVSADAAIFDPSQKEKPGYLASFCEGKAGKDIMRIEPKQGDAILFTPMRPWMQTDERAIHGACHVTRGEKWVVQRWARDIYDPGYARDWKSHQAKLKKKLHEEL